MKRPFNIFPNIGYKNSQFQIVSSVDNLRIDIYNKNEVVKSIEANSKYPTLLTSLNSAGKLIAKCRFNNELFQQEIEVKDAFRLGSSEFKKAFVFDDTKYSFFLMKDRLLLYDEKKKILLTENHYSPTEIHKINETSYLFVTKVGNFANGIINLGIYNTETFSIVGELLNDYREIKILPESNKVWLHNIKSNTIHCFELAKDSNKYFTELKKYDGFSSFFIEDSSQNIFIKYIEKLNIANINNLHKSIEIPKLPNNAIDKLGNLFSIENSILTCTKLLTDYSVKIQPTFQLNLQAENFIHVGNDLKSQIELTDLHKKVEEIKDDIIASIPENKTYYNHTLPESERISDSYTDHNIYPTIDGIFIVDKEVKRDFNGVTLRKNQANWNASPNTIERNEYTLSFFSLNKVEVLINKAPSISITEYHNLMLLVNSQNTKFLFSSNNKFPLESESSIKLFTVNEISYFLIRSMEKYSLYRATNFKNPILNQIEILNPDLIEEHQIIWYSGKEKYVSETNYLNAFNLRTCSKIFIDERKVQHSLFKDSTEFKFYKRYALSANNIVFNPINLEIKDAFIGTIESYSKNLDKIISHRTNTIYLSVYHTHSQKYELSEIQLDDHKYKESYLSPSGQFLVLQDENNKYVWYDIEKNETVKFISGNFLAFRNDGSLVVEQDKTRAVKIIDPKTFQDITPPNYHHYRFMSPDGKLYAQVSSEVRYFNKLNGKEITLTEVSKYRQDLDEPSFYLQEKEKEQAKLKVEKNREQIFTSFKRQFEELGVEDHSKINSQFVIKVDKFVEIGIVGTNKTIEVQLPTDTNFYNYASFSFDNQYLGIVGKPTFGSINRSLILICSISFDEKSNSLEINNNMISRFPSYAAWVCGFSKSGYFATYDSSPDTFLINIGNDFFEDETNDLELRQNINNSRNNIYNSYKRWNVIKGKNFLCFSPTGVFLALSEQGYEPLTKGGYGHQESNVVHIAKTNSGEIIDSFTGHGDKIKDNKTKKVTFVAFSEDEKRIMTLSSDGVVIIRDLNILESVEIKQEEEMPAANKL